MEEHITYNKRRLGIGFPNKLGLIDVLCRHGDLVSDQKSGIETNTELANKSHGIVTTLSRSFQELGRSRSCNGSQIVNQIRLGHTDTPITNGEGLLLRVRFNVDLHVFTSILKGLIGQHQKADLLKGIGSIGDQLTKEDILVRICNTNTKRKKQNMSCSDKGNGSMKTPYTANG